MCDGAAASGMPRLHRASVDASGRAGTGIGQDTMEGRVTRRAEARQGNGTGQGAMKSLVTGGAVEGKGNRR